MQGAPGPSRLARPPPALPQREDDTNHRLRLRSHAPKPPHDPRRAPPLVGHETLICDIWAHPYPELLPPDVQALLGADDDGLDGFVEEVDEEFEDETDEE